MANASSVDAFIDEFNSKYLSVHKNFEDNFWSTKMNLTGASTQDLVETKVAMDEFLGSKANLAEVRAKMEGATPEQLKTLKIMEKTFLCYIMENEEAAKLSQDLVGMEGKLQENRNGMKLGYTKPDTGEFKEGSSVLLRTYMRSDEDEATRKACYEGLLAIGDFVAEDFVGIIKARNQMAKKLGYEDFYDYKVTQAEGFSKRQLFEMLTPLEEQTRPLMVAAREKLAAEKGADALHPWNMGFALSGDVDKLQDPYFPFERAPAVWGRSFAALGIDYKESTMNLDLCDRAKKYSNGFCHWPIAPFKKSSGEWVPAQTNFTSLATPSAVGSGATALTTLMHEGGHAAHFANIDQGSPFFSQERAPTSVAYAENQSMFLDALCDDAAWLGKYAVARDGSVMPFNLIEQALRSKFPYKVFEVRSMLAVPYFEKALYEMPEDDLTVESLLALATKVELEIQGGPAGRPLMSVPHILSDESSCYYHGYVLAEMSVHQTRAHFFSKYGYIVDNPKVGADLTEVYWKPGNGAPFLELVEQLTGATLTADAWVAALQADLETKLRLEKEAYEKAVKEGPVTGEKGTEALNMRTRFVHGDLLIADSAEDGGFDSACSKFESWVQAEYFAAKA